MSSSQQKNSYKVRQTAWAKQARRLQRLLFRSIGRLSGGETRRFEDDYSLAVPFGFDVSAASDRPRKLAAICHIFYVDLAEEMLGYLSHLPNTTDLFISTTDEAKAAALREIFRPWKQGRVEIRIAPNQGRDIAPKFLTFRDVYEMEYEAILFLHSKKTEREDARSWRVALFATLAGSRETVGSVLTAFDRNSSLGMIVPQHHELVRRHSGWQNNFLHARRLARGMGFRLKASYKLDFAAGSMFWARPEALRPLLQINLQLQDFPSESGQIGDTIAHAIERLMLFSCERAGYTWCKIADPACFAPGATVVRVANEDALGEFQRVHNFRLLPLGLTGSRRGGGASAGRPHQPSLPRGDGMTGNGNTAFEAGTVSVAMCTFNGSRYLPEQLNSIAQQTSLPDELVICDDGSTDDTVAILSAFAKSAPFPVHIHQNETRLKFSGNFAKCIGLCTGEVTVLTDQDDVWMLDRVERTRADFAKDPKLTFTFSDAPLIDDAGKPLGRTIFSGMSYPARDQQTLDAGASMFPFLVRWAGLLGCTLAFRTTYRSLFLPLPPAWPHDTWLTIVLSSLGPSLRQSPVTNYRQHAAQVIGAEDGSMTTRISHAQKRGLEQARQEMEHTQQAVDAAAQHPELSGVLLPTMQQRVRFLSDRYRIKSGGLGQLPLLIKLLAGGQYRRHSAGLRSAVKDAAMLVGAVKGQ